MSLFSSPISRFWRHFVRPRTLSKYRRADGLARTSGHPSKYRLVRPQCSNPSRSIHKYNYNLSMQHHSSDSTFQSGKAEFTKCPLTAYEQPVPQLSSAPWLWVELAWPLSPGLSWATPQQNLMRQPRSSKEAQLLSLCLLRAQNKSITIPSDFVSSYLKGTMLAVYPWHVSVPH